MPLELDPDLPTPLIPLAWLVGVWAGAGVVGYPTMQDTRFGQEVSFRHDGRPFLAYSSRTWLLDEDGVAFVTAEEFHREEAESVAS